MVESGFTAPRPAQLRRFGRVFYPAGLRLQKALSAYVSEEGRPDQLVILEHDPVFTLGRNATPADIHVSDDFLASQGVGVHRTDRGGEVTYHGPGQIVAYPLLDLRRLGLGVRELVQRIEQAIIDTLDVWNVVALRRAGAPGVYVGAAKIAALGLRVRRGCTFHGLAFNVAMDLEPFGRINPCGFHGLAVTQLSDIGGPSRLADVEDVLIGHLCRQFGLRAEAASPILPVPATAAPIPVP